MTPNTFFKTQWHTDVGGNSTTTNSEIYNQSSRGCDWLETGTQHPHQFTHPFPCLFATLHKPRGKLFSPVGQTWDGYLERSPDNVWKSFSNTSPRLVMLFLNMCNGMINLTHSTQSLSTFQVRPYFHKGFIHQWMIYSINILFMFDGTLYKAMHQTYLCNFKFNTASYCWKIAHAW